MLQEPARSVNETPNFSGFDGRSRGFCPSASVAKYPLTQ